MNQNKQKFTISMLYKHSSLTTLEDTFDLVNDLIDNLDPIALNELCEGYSWDIDNLFLDLMKEANEIINSGKGVASFSFNYLTALTDNFDLYLKKISLAYFISTVLSDSFNIEPYHLEWSNLVSIYPKLCILAARGHSKSFFFSFAYPLWRMYKYKKQRKAEEITIVTAEETLSSHFIDLIEKEIDQNVELKEKLYPNGKGTWNKTALETKQGLVLRAKGSTSSLRGLHSDLIVDDLLDESNFYNAEVRKETIEFFNSVLMNIPLPKVGKVCVVGCVTKDTLVLDKEKGFCNIIDLAPKGVNLYTKGLYELKNKVLDSHNTFVQNTKFWVNGKVNTTEILLDNGYQIIGSDIHPLWVFNQEKGEEWVKLPNLKVGDIVEVKDNKEVEDWGEYQKIEIKDIPYSEKLKLPTYLNEDLSYFLGVFCAEGNLHTNGKQIQIANQEIDFDFLFKYNLPCNSQKEKGKYLISRKVFYNWVKNIFELNPHDKANKKQIPAIVLASPKKILRAFLQGYFDGDGTSSGGHISCCSVSKTLIKQIQYVLCMGFGIESKLSIYTAENFNSNPKNNAHANFDNYSLYLDIYNSELFYNRIGFRLKRKQENRKLLNPQFCTLDEEQIPAPLRLLQEIKDLSQTKYTSEAKISKVLPSGVLRRKQKYVLRKILKNIVNQLLPIFKGEDKNLILRLKEYSEKNWRIIEKISPMGENYTYDFVIPSNHIFIGNGIKNHQTPFSEDDLYAYLKKAKGWRVFEYPGIYPDGSLLSPERFSLEELLDKRYSIGSIAFSREILMKPISSNMSLFPMKILKMNLVETANMANSRFNLPIKVKRICFGVDLAISANTNESADADYFVVAIIGIDENNRYWILNIYRQRGLTYLQQINIVKALNERYNPETILVESNQYQLAFAQMLKDNGLDNVKDRKTTNKNKYDFQTGIPALSVLFEQFRIKIPYNNDTYTRNQADIIMAEFNSMTFNDNKLQSVNQHDDTCMAIWLGVTALNTVNGITVSFLTSTGQNFD